MPQRAAGGGQIPELRPVTNPATHAFTQNPEGQAAGRELSEEANGLACHSPQGTCNRGRTTKHTLVKSWKPTRCWLQGARMLRNALPATSAVCGDSGAGGGKVRILPLPLFLH